MSLHCLVLSSDDSIMRTLRRVLSDLGISVEHCADPEAAVRCLTRRRFEAVIVDCWDEKTAAQVLRSVRSAPRNKRAVAMAVIDSQADVRSVFRLGAHFALHKPLTLERARSSFRAARALMKCERRKNARVAVEIPVSMWSGAQGSEQMTTTSDLGEGGMAVKLPRRTKLRGDVRVRFMLPGSDQIVQCPVKIAWEGSGSQTGIRFLELAREHRDHLRSWLNRYSPELEPQDPPTVCQLTDLSAGGCYLKTATPFPVGTRVATIVRDNKTAIYAAAIVRVMHPDEGMGLEFLQNVEQQLPHMLNSLAKAEGTTPQMEVEPEGFDDSEISVSDAVADPLLNLFRRGFDLNCEAFQAELRELRRAGKGAARAASA